MLLEAIVAQKEGPVDATGTRHSMAAFAPLMQSLLGALAVLCGFTHEEGYSNFELFHLDVDEAASILTVTGVCIEFLTNCHVLAERQVAMIYISIIWQHLLPVLPTTLPLFKVILFRTFSLVSGGVLWLTMAYRYRHVNIILFFVFSLLI